MSGTGSQELYPFVFEAVGDWEVSTAVAPPEGFVSDYDSLAEQVVNEIEAVQFTITDIGSDWVPTQAKHTVSHGGRRQVILSRVGVRLASDLAQQKGLDRSGHVLDAGGKSIPKAGFDPREPPECEIVGWVEPLAHGPELDLQAAGRRRDRLDTPDHPRTRFGRGDSSRRHP